MAIKGKGNQTIQSRDLPEGRQKVKRTEGGEDGHTGQRLNERILVGRKRMEKNEKEHCVCTKRRVNRDGGKRSNRFGAKGSL